MGAKSLGEIPSPRRTEHGTPQKGPMTISFNKRTLLELGEVRFPGLEVGAGGCAGGRQRRRAPTTVTAGAFC